MYRASDLCPNLILENRYILIRQLGKGGFATVWEVEDLQTQGDRKAIKVCNQHRLKKANLLRQEFWTLQELQSHWQVDRRIVQVEQFYPLKQPEEGDYIPLHFFVMEKINGKTLQELLTELAANSANHKSIDQGRLIYQKLFYRYPSLQSQLTYEKIAYLLEQLAEVLHYLHYQHNLILRDLNPNNIMVMPNYEIKLIDFGGAKKVDLEDQIHFFNYLNRFDRKSVTRIVTYGYTAPEQKDGQAFFRSDFYSLGQTILFALTGQNTYTTPELSQNWRSQIPVELSKFIDKATNTDPLKRHADSGQLLKEAKEIVRSLRNQFGKGAAIKQLQKILGIATIAIISTIGMRAIGLLQSSEFIAYDQMLRMRPSFPNAHKITIVAIQPSDAEWMGGRNISNKILTRMLTNLLPHQPKVIGITLDRDEPGENGIEELRKLLQENNHIFGSCEPKSPINPAVSFQPKPSSPLGFSTVVEDSDKFYRRQYLLFYEDPDLQTIDDKCPTQFSFNLAIANHYLQGVNPIKNIIPNSPYQLGLQLIPSLNAEGAYQGLSDEGFDYIFQILVDYQLVSQIATKVSLQDVIEQKVDSKLINNRVILIGRMDASIDLPRDTPYGALHSVEMRAQIISYLIDLGEGKRQLLRSASWWLDYILIIGIAIAASFISWRFPVQRVHLWHLLIVVVCLWICCWLTLLWQSLWLGYIPMVIASILAIMGEFAYTKVIFALSKIYVFCGKKYQQISSADCDNSLSDRR
jgi:CHASE2 domain-containing sensor protein